MAVASTSNTLADNASVQELFGVLKENNKDTAGLTALLGYVKQMEDFVKSAEGQIHEMKSQIGEISEIQKHPIKAALKNASESLETKVTGIKAQLNKIRSRIVEACKNTLTAFKNKGITALDKLADFLGIKKACEKIKKDCNQVIMQCDKSVAKIEQFSNEYHQTGLHLKNMLRVVVGRKAVLKPTENGMLAKSMCAPYKALRKCLNSIRNAADKAINKLDALWINADDIRKERQATKLERKDPAAAHLATYEAKAKQINIVNAEKAIDKASDVIGLKPKVQSEAVIA